MFNYDKLNDAIIKSGKTKTYLCQKLGRPPYYLRDVIRQKNNIPKEYQEILAMECGVTVEYLNDEQEKEKPTMTGEQISEARKQLYAALEDMTDEELLFLMSKIKAIKNLRG